MSDKHELLADVEEVTRLLDTATRPAVVEALTAIRNKSQAALTEIEAAERAAAEAEEKQRAWQAETSEKLEQLEQAKAKAAADEDYEACARLRDEIAELRAKLEDPAAAADGEAAAAVPVPVPSVRPVVDGMEWQPLDRFAWDQGEYNTPWVTIYATLPGVGSVKDKVTCDFTADSFDLKVVGLNGANYRLLKSPLEKDIEVEKCKFIVKPDRVTIKLRKIKGQYSYDNWNDLVPKRPKTDKEKADPTAGIMDMMKDMYDSGDDATKKAIGEAMLKSRQEKGGMGGM